MSARSHLRVIAKNIAWLFGDKILRMAGSILLAIWLARYLGAEQFGIYNYVIAFVALFTPIASLGLNEIVVRDLVRHPNAAPVILGTTATLLIGGGVAAFASCLAGFLLFGTGGIATGALVAILGTTLLLKATEVVKYWYQSHTASRETIRIESGMFALFCAVKLLLIVLHAPLKAFVIALAAEAIATAIGLMLLYVRKVGTQRLWKFQWERAKELLGDGMPLILSGSFVLLNMNLDKVMLGQMSGPLEVGLYSAASRLTESWYFLPTIVGMSIAPRLTQLYSHDREAYTRTSQSAFNALTTIAFFVCILATIFSNAVIKVIYGNEYDQAAPMLVVHVWTALFVFHVSLRTQLLVIERKRTLILAFSSLNLLANFSINLFAIPRAGGLGASYASLISWALCVLIFPLAFMDSRRYPMQFFFQLPRSSRDHD